MSGFESFLDMGGYARFVWPAYGLTLIVLLINLVLPIVRERRLLRRLSERHRREIKE